MRFLCGSLVGAAPEGPGDDVGGVDASLCEALSYPADFLDRPANERWGVLAVGRLVFFGISRFA